MDDTFSLPSAPKRRASEPQSSEALALVSSFQRNYQRVPPPLPYLPSDYEPSPESPRQYLIPATAGTEALPNERSKTLLLYNANTDATSIGQRRQRAHSIDYPLAIVSSNLNNNVNSTNRDHLELVPYREWTVIARNNQKGQLVLYNQDSQSIALRHYVPEEYSAMPSIPLEVAEEEFCPYCHQRLHHTPRSSPLEADQPDYMDRNYFRLLASSSTAQISPIQSRSDTTNTTSSSTDEVMADSNNKHEEEQQQIPPSFDNQNLNANAFNQGYYTKFFVEINKLGKGFRGSVFLCEHRLDGVKLGKYAVKKVAIGNNHPWLVRMLREVHLLERLRHPNIVSYKHSWLEYARLTQFGPEVPCLFILMECANGGNLEEYFERDGIEKHQNSSNSSNHKPVAADRTDEAQSSSIPLATPAEASQKRKMSAKELKRERIRRQYREQEAFEQEQINISEPITHVDRRLLTLQEIWSLFLDIVQGLAHLHQQNIVHRDLKPPNLLLQYDNQHNRYGRRGIPRVLISDFGECEDLAEAYIDKNRTGATGTLEFMAPEHVRLDPHGRNMVDYSPKADMWSLGMVLYFLCYSRLPYNVIDDVDILRKEILAFREIRFPASRFDIYKDNPAFYAEARENPNLTPDIPKEIKQLIRMLLSVDPIKRPSCNEILSKIQSFRRDESTLSSIFEHNNATNRWKTMAANKVASVHTSPTQSPAVSTTTIPAASPPISSPPIASPYPLHRHVINRVALSPALPVPTSQPSSPDGSRTVDVHTISPSQNTSSSQTNNLDKMDLEPIGNFEQTYNNSNSKRAQCYQHYPASRVEHLSQSVSSLQSKDYLKNATQYVNSDIYARSNDTSLSLRKRQRVSPDNDGDIVMDENDTNDGMDANQGIHTSQENADNDSSTMMELVNTLNRTETPPSAPPPPRLLLDSPSPSYGDTISNPVFKTKWLSDQQILQLIKTITAVLKIASCTYPCSPYSAHPLILYPTIFFATLDFWCESSSPSFVLLLLHVVWIMGATLLSASGMCVA